MRGHIQCTKQLCFYTIQQPHNSSDRGTSLPPWVIQLMFLSQFAYRAWRHIRRWLLRQGSYTRSSNRGTFRRFFLLVCEALFKFLVMPCQVAESFLHLRWVGSAILLRYDISVPQLVYHIFHRLCLLFRQHNNIPQKREEVQSFFENKSNFFHGAFLWLLHCKFCVLREGTWLFLRSMV